MSVSSRGVSTCVETARLPVSGGGGRNAPAQKSGGRCKEPASVARNLRRATPQEPIFRKLSKTQRRGGGSRDQMALVANAPRRASAGAVGRGRRDEPKQARERRAGGDHRQRHLRPVLPARRLRAYPGDLRTMGAGGVPGRRVPPFTGLPGARARRPRRAAASRSPRRTPGSPRRPVRPNEPDERIRTARDERPRRRVGRALRASPRDPDSTFITRRARTLPKLRIVR